MVKRALSLLKKETKLLCNFVQMKGSINFCYSGKRNSSTCHGNILHNSFGIQFQKQQRKAAADENKTKKESFRLIVCESAGWLVRKRLPPSETRAERTRSSLTCFTYKVWSFKKKIYIYIYLII